MLRFKPFFASFFVFFPVHFHFYPPRTKNSYMRFLNGYSRFRRIIFSKTPSENAAQSVRIERRFHFALYGFVFIYYLSAIAACVVAIPESIFSLHYHALKSFLLPYVLRTHRPHRFQRPFARRYELSHDFFYLQ